MTSQPLNPRTVIPGDRVRLIAIHDPYTSLEPGHVGVVNHVDAVGTVHVDWEGGSRLGLLPDIDRYELANSG